MQYRRITTARIFEYGKGKMFRSKKMALEEANREKNDLRNVSIKNKRKTDFKILETDKNIQLLLYVYVPITEN